MNVVNILLFVLIGLCLWIGMSLVTTAHENKLPNLNWLAMGFFLYVVGLSFAPTVGNPLAATPVSLWFFQGLLVFIQFGIIMFVHETFYRDKKSPMGWILGFHVVAVVPTFYGIAISENAYAQSPWIVASQISQAVIWGWHAWAGYQARQSVAGNALVDDWVKARYQLIIWYSIITVVSSFSNFVRILSTGGSSVSVLGNTMALISLVLYITSVVLQFLAWVMPKGYRRWLNRNYQPPQMEEHEEL